MMRLLLWGAAVLTLLTALTACGQDIADPLELEDLTEVEACSLADLSRYYPYEVTSTDIPYSARASGTLIDACHVIDYQNNVGEDGLLYIVTWLDDTDAQTIDRLLDRYGGDDGGVQAIDGVQIRADEHDEPYEPRRVVAVADQVAIEIQVRSLGGRGSVDQPDVPHALITEILASLDELN